MKPESSLPHSQVPATCPYPEPAPSSPHSPLPLPEDLVLVRKINGVHLPLLGHPPPPRTNYAYACWGSDPVWGLEVWKKRIFYPCRESNAGCQAT
jgi:hypothetical protein